MRTSSWSHLWLLWRCQLQLWLHLLIVLQQSQSDKAGTDPFLPLTPILNELSFSAPSSCRDHLTHSPGKLHLQDYIELYVTFTWGNRVDTFIGVGWLLDHHKLGITSHVRGACESTFCLLFGQQHRLLLTAAMEDALKEEINFVTDSGLLFVQKMSWRLECRALFWWWRRVLISAVIRLFRQNESQAHHDRHAGNAHVDKPDTVPVAVGQAYMKCCFT